MKQSLALTIAVLGLAAGVNAQEISPYLFGQNHWIAEGDEGNRVGYLHLLWPKVQESGITTVRIGGNGYNHHLPERQRLTAMIDSIRHIGAEPILQVPRNFTAIQTMELVEYYTKLGKKRFNTGPLAMSRCWTARRPSRRFTPRSCGSPRR